MVTFSQAGLPWPLALVLAMVLTGFVAAGVERVIVRPVIGRPVFVTIILTIFVAYILRAAVAIAFGGDTEGLATPWDPLGTVEIAGAYVTYNWLACLAASLIALVAAMRPKSHGSSTIGMKKSVVLITPRPSPKS